MAGFKVAKNKFWLIPLKTLVLDHEDAVWVPFVNSIRGKWPHWGKRFVYMCKDWIPKQTQGDSDTVISAWVQKTLCSQTPLRQTNHLKITENKKFLRVPPSRSVVAEECMRPGQIELHFTGRWAGCAASLSEAKLVWWHSSPTQVFTKQRWGLYCGKIRIPDFSRQKSVAVSRL